MERASARRGGEADLVVDDDVHRAAGAVALQLREVEASRPPRPDRRRRRRRGSRIGSDLACGSRVVAAATLLGPHLAQHDRVDDLEVARVGGQRQVDRVAVELAVRRGAQVVLHVARALDVRGTASRPRTRGRSRGRACPSRWRARSAGRGAPCRDDLVDAQLAAALDDLLQRRDHGLAAVQAEPLGAGETLVQEPSRSPRPRSACSGWRSCPRWVKVSLVAAALDPLLQPGLLLRLGDVHELTPMLPQ